MDYNLALLATGVGSLPHLEIKEAVEMIRHTFEDIPHWPQLPNQGTNEDMLNQYISPLVKLGLVTAMNGQKPFFDTARPDWFERVADFYGSYLEIIESSGSLSLFSFPEDSAQGFYTFLKNLTEGIFTGVNYVKGQITGPLTLGLQITDQNKKSAYYSQELREIVVKSLALQALWQTKELGRFGKPVLIFIDEPGLYAYGQSTFITLKKNEITDEFNEIIDAIHSVGGMAGIHVCASTDWSIILDSQADILNFDAFGYFTSLTLYIDELKIFLERGGILAWGLVPTSEKVLDLKVEDLMTIFEQSIDSLVQKGVPKDRLLQQALITPSCGVGSCSVELAERVYGLTLEVSLRLREKYGFLL